MLKKIINLFGKKKKKSSFRKSKVKGDNKNNIIVPFFRTLKKEKKVETIETESQ